MSGEAIRGWYNSHTPADVGAAADRMAQNFGELFVGKLSTLPGIVNYTDSEHPLLITSIGVPEVEGPAALIVDENHHSIGMLQQEQGDN